MFGIGCKVGVTVMSYFGCSESRRCLKSLATLLYPLEVGTEGDRGVKVKLRESAM